MSCLHIPIPKKLKQLPSSSKKAWKSFTSSIQPKVYYLHTHLKNIPSTITRTARRLRHGRRRRRPMHHYHYRHLHLSSSSPASVYVDRLFDEASSVKVDSSSGSTTASASTSSAHGAGNYAPRRRTARSEKVEGSNVNWKQYISSLPKIQGVDERAQEFISKFRQQMQLQREQSLLEFQQMLDRSA